MIEKIRNEQTDALCKAFASLKTVEECYKFLDDLCTLSEVTEMGKRLSAARMLREGITYNEIAVRTGLSTATITRVNRALRYGSDGISYGARPADDMSFDSLYALHYDRFSGADYASYAAFFMEAARRFADVALREALDLGCGAGGLSAVLAGAGLDMVGLDVSPEMLSVARAKPENRDVLLLCQDMREMELYGTVQGAVSAYDCLNYLGSLSELSDVLALLHNYIEPGGVFVFDVNTPARYERVYADNCFCFEDDGALLVWRNEYAPKSRRNRMELTLFARRADGGYDRFDDVAVQRCFSLPRIERAAVQAGFAVCGVFGGTDFSALTAESEKAFFVLKRI